MPSATGARRRSAPRRPSAALHVLVYPDGGRMLAHVLETDTVSEGDTPAAALRQVAEALRIEFAFDERERRSTGPSPAPTVYWSALKSARLEATPRLVLPSVGATTLLAHRVDEAPRP